MKNLIFALALFIIIITPSEGWPNVDVKFMEANEPTAAEIKKSRACFNELEKMGCGHPKEHLNRFRNCLSDVFPALSSPCQDMMSEIYGRKK